VADGGTGEAGEERGFLGVIEVEDVPGILQAWCLNLYVATVLYCIRSGNGLINFSSTPCPIDQFLRSIFYSGD
jgi:hypothetical protein